MGVDINILSIVQDEHNRARSIVIPVLRQQMGQTVLGPISISIRGKPDVGPPTPAVATSLSKVASNFI